MGRWPTWCIVFADAECYQGESSYEKSLVDPVLYRASVVCVAACGKEPEPAAEPSTESIPVSSNTLISTEPQKPYWDTHEPLSYAGIYNGQRFSGDYEIASYDKTKEGDACLKLPRLEGKVEDVAQQFLVRKETITDPFLDIYYDKKNNRYVDAWQTGYRMDKDGYPEFDFKTTTYYYSNTSCHDSRIRWVVLY